MLHRQQFLEAGKQRPQSEWDVGCVGCMNELQGSFFFSAFYFRGIRDDIEEEDEQVSEPSTVFHPWLVTTPDETLDKYFLSDS